MNGAFSKHTLDNGLRLFFEPIPRIHSAAVGFLADTGSRDERPEEAGISHFLEHMCFKGTANRDWRQLSLDIDDIGAIWNAGTWWEGTSYFHWVQHDRADRSIEILSDMMRSTLPPDEFDTEKNVILEEIAMYRDRPDALIFDEIMQQAFPNHPLGQSVIGTEASVSGISRDAMADYHERRYVPENMMFIITGRFDRDAVIESVERACGRWKPGGAGRKQQQPSFERGLRVVERGEVTREHIALAFPAPPASDDHAITAGLLATYLGASTSSRLYWSLVHAGLADEAVAEYIGFSDAGLFYVYLSVDPQNVDRALDALRHECRALAENFDAEAFKRVRTKSATSLVCQAEHGLHRFNLLVNDLSTKAPLKSIDQHLAEIQTVDKARIEDYLSHYALHGDPALVAMGPLSELPAF